MNGLERQARSSQRKCHRREPKTGQKQTRNCQYRLAEPLRTSEGIRSEMAEGVGSAIYFLHREAKVPRSDRDEYALDLSELHW